MAHMVDRELVTAAVKQIEREYLRARTKFPPMNSAHEGYAVLLEEVDELWDEIKHGGPERAREEAIQVGAMALAILVDVLGLEPKHFIKAL